MVDQKERRREFERQSERRKGREGNMMEQSKYTYSIEETGAGGISASRATKRWQRKWFVDRACAEPAQIIERMGRMGRAT